MGFQQLVRIDSRNFSPLTLNCSAITRILMSKEVTTTGADMVSTEVANPEVHAEDSDYLVNPAEKLIVANDDNYAMAA